MPVAGTYFATVRTKLNLKTLRDCQTQAFAALSNYYGGGGRNAACVMSVGAGKTALGVLAALVFTRRRALIVTPGSVIRGTFDKALNHQVVGNTLYGLPGGPLIPMLLPRVRILDREAGPIRGVSSQELLSADILVTNFHSLGTGSDEDDLLAKLAPEDIDYVVIDEAHIAAADSYQRLFAHFTGGTSASMSACFQRETASRSMQTSCTAIALSTRSPIATQRILRVHRFAPQAEQTMYEIIWPDSRREEIVRRQARADDDPG